jgi:hypothetical protein
MEVEVEAFDLVPDHVDLLSRRPCGAHSHGEVLNQPLEGGATTCRAARAHAALTEPSKILRLVRCDAHERLRSGKSGG